ncbi:MAG: hypothetical protein BWX84_02530 [Verrucomicrobia bacterium ADurb.Bin118]|nr:MAG: hypothetical protein BWX84_02530 [Verrucomicrobia bacterium ADurb.Bin118]
MAVVVFAGLEADEHGAGLFPTAAQRDHFRSPEVFVQRHPGGGGIRLIGRIPEHIQGLRPRGARLIPRPNGLLKTPRQPKQLRRVNLAAAAIGVIKRLPDGTGDVQRKPTCLCHARQRGQVEVCPQRRLERGQQRDLVPGGVMPVARTFNAGAVRGKLAHGRLHRVQAGMQNARGQGGLDLRQGERPNAEAAVADLIPIVPGLHPPTAFGIYRQRRSETMFDDGRLQRPALGVVPGVVKPVVSNRESVGHFCGVEEMSRIPILEGGGGFQFAPGAVRPAAVVVQLPEQPQRLHPVQHAPAGGEQPQAVRDFIFRGRRGEQGGGLGSQSGVPADQLFIGGHPASQCGKIRGGGQQPGMPPVQVGEKLIGGRNGPGQGRAGGGRQQPQPQTAKKDTFHRDRSIKRPGKRASLFIQATVRRSARKVVFPTRF